VAWVKGLLRELKVFGFIAFMGATVWAYALAASVREQEGRIRYWPALTAENSGAPMFPESVERPLPPGVASVGE
jgi:hypothetical protein